MSALPPTVVPSLEGQQNQVFSITICRKGNVVGNASRNPGRDHPHHDRADEGDGDPDQDER
jgi:hypothetical protein